MENKFLRRERDFQRHRNDIMIAAEKLFEEDGYYETTMNKIADRADFSKGSLYNYFESKEVLFFDILNEKIETFRKGLTETTNEFLTIEEKICAFIEFYFDFFSKNIGFFKIAQTEKFSLSNLKHKSLMTSLKGKYFNHITRIGEILKLNERKSIIEVDLTASAISGILNGLMTRYFLYDKKIEIDNIKLFAKEKIIELIK